MAKLVEVEGYAPGREVPIQDTLVIGRDPGPGGLVVPNKEVSRRHARIVRLRGGYRLEDLGSANGTLVNGQRVDRVDLSEGLVFTVGRTTFRFSLEPVRAVAGGRSREVHRHGESGSGARSSRSRDAGTPGGPLSDPEVGETPERPSARKLGRRLAQRLGKMAVWNLTLDAHSTRMGYITGEEIPTNIRRERDVLEILCEISRTIGSILHLPTLVQEILSKTFELFPVAENASIHLLEGAGLRPLGARSRDGGVIDAPRISSTIASLALRDRQSILSTDALVDERFQDRRSVILQRVRSFMCSPLLFQDEVLGVLYVDTTDALPQFTADDLSLFTAVSAQVAVAVKNSQLLEENLRQAEVRAHLSRYLPPDLVEQVLNHQIDITPGGSLRTGTILFSDIVGFTPMAERVGPERLVTNLNQYFKLMVDTIFRHGGSVNRFGGDSILAIWGVPMARPDDTLRAVRCAVDMQATVFALNLGLGKDGAPPIEVGIGLNSGSFVVGNIGSERHMEYTAMGNDVNVAQRVESRAAGRQVLVSASTFATVQGHVHAFALPPTPLKGVSEPMPLYAIRAVRGDDDTILCAVPVSIARPEGPLGQAMITRILPDRVLEVWTGDTLSPGQTSTLVLEVPEFPEMGSIVVQVREATPLSEHFPDTAVPGARLLLALDSDLPPVLEVPRTDAPAPGCEYLQRH